MKYKQATTTQLKNISQNSIKAHLSRLPDDTLWDQIDPRGRHILNCVPQPGERNFVRTFAMVKLRGSDEPAEIFLDLLPDDWAGLRAVTGE